MKSWIAFIATPFIIYPIALGFVLLSDLLLGESEFLRHFFLESKRETLQIVLHDWASALPYCLPLWLLHIGLEKFANRIWAYSIDLIVIVALLCFTILPPQLPLIFASIALATLICAVASQRWLKDITR